ncbi:MAG: tetratricopeptide repeat protein [Gammaproteobacteria bacterium]
MAETHSMLTSLIRHPVSFSILVLSVVILIVWFDYKSTVSPSTAVAPIEESRPAQMAGGSISQPIALSPPGAQPKIMDQFDSSKPQSGAPAIDALLGRLEEKVKADPGNLDNRILLAQTYKELGRMPDALQELRGIQQQNPDNSRANLVLASILSQSSDPKELEEALQVLANVKEDAGIQPYLIHMYKGDALIRQQNHEGALENWKQALATMPKSDARYGVLEKKVMDLTSGSANISPGS